MSKIKSRFIHLKKPPFLKNDKIWQMKKTIRSNGNAKRQNNDNIFKKFYYSKEEAILGETIFGAGDIV